MVGISTGYCPEGTLTGTASPQPEKVAMSASSKRRMRHKYKTLCEVYTHAALEYHWWELCAYNYAYDSLYSPSSEVTAEREILGDINENLSYFALDFDTEMKGATERFDNEQTNDIRTVGSGHPEVLTQPSFVGKETATRGFANVSITECDADGRKDLYANEALSAGTTKTSEIGENMTNEPTDLAPSTMKIRSGFTNWDFWQYTHEIHTGQIRGTQYAIKFPLQPTAPPLAITDREVQFTLLKPVPLSKLWEVITRVPEPIMDRETLKGMLEQEIRGYVDNDCYSQMLQRLQDYHYLRIDCNLLHIDLG